ncbi:MAG: hypothetical protein GF370_00135, partial [Candidatus Nealsonbacteria bacterium]|nr:hypothetical protein [Candidatus Nealsonbacteria bacterium]
MNNSFKKYLGSTITLVFVLAACFYPGSSEAKTTVTRDGCDITITVYLAFAFIDDVAWANAQQLVSEWVDGMLDIWNEPDFTYSSGLCECPVHFEVVVDILPKDKDCSHAKQNMPGWHCVNVVNEPVNQRGNVADAHKTPVDNGDGFGEWTTMTTGLNAAHEVGHFMGLGEEYHRDQDGNWKPDDPNKEDSIMARTWGDVQAYPEHIDEIIDDSSVDCPEPECCCGNGEHEGYDQMMGEECDYTATPSGCGQGEVCDTNCKCVAQPKVTPICGDGYITAPEEECDPQSSPTGCSPEKECIGCKCHEKEVEAPPAPSPDPAQMIVAPGSLSF